MSVFGVSHTSSRECAHMRNAEKFWPVIVYERAFVQVFLSPYSIRRHQKAPSTSPFETLSPSFGC